MGACAFGSAARAQEAERVTIDAGRCTEIESPSERLACFEAQVEAAREGDSPASTTSSAPPQSASSATRTVDLSRVRDPDARDGEPNERVGSISSLTERQPNRYLITLDNGEMWMQQVAERYPLRVGQRVRIYASRWGNAQRLEAVGIHGFIQVERVR
jgi:hypothetical protein